MKLRITTNDTFYRVECYRQVGWLWWKRWEWVPIRSIVGVPLEFSSYNGAWWYIRGEIQRSLGAVDKWKTVDNNEWTIP